MLTSVDKNRLFALNTVSGVYSLIDRCIVWESIIQMKDEKATGLAGLVEEMVKPRGELKVYRAADLMDQILIEVGFPAEYERSTITNCYKEKGGDSKREN